MENSKAPMNLKAPRVLVVEDEYLVRDMIVFELQLEQIPADVGHCLYPAWRK